MAIVFIQHIKTIWRKDARGGEKAVQRNAVPEVAKLSLRSIVTRTPVVVQQDLYYGAKNFTDPREKITTDTILRPIEIGGVTVDHSSDLVFARFQYTARCGAPMRGWARKSLQLSLGEWAQFVYNGRFSPGWEGDWRYEKHVVNVGQFARLSSGLFTRCAPTTRFEALGELH